MGWNYNEPDEYKCSDCDHVYPFKRDTIFMATHEGRPGHCPNCKGSNTVKLEDPEIDSN